MIAARHGVWARAAVGAAFLAGPRGVLVALHLRTIPGELDAVSVRHALAHFSQGVLLAFVALFLVAVAVRRLAGLSRALVGAAVLIAGFAFLTFRLPAVAPYVPALVSTRGVLVNASAGVCALAAAWVAVGRLRWPGLAPVGASVLVVAACAWLYAQVTAGPPASWPERPNVILVSLDTLRADHLGCYGYERDTSPSLDAFAERALRFDNAFASSSWTLTSHMTLLTSLSPIVHAVDEDRALSTGVTTLATALLREGYFTAAVMDSGPWLGRDYGFDRGFLHVRRTLRGAPAKIARALDCLDGTDDRPFFLFLHLYDAHSDSTRLPYDAAAEDQELFRGDYAGDFTGCGSDGTCASAWMRKLNRRGEVLDEEDRRYVEALYDAGIRTLDRELGRLFRELERRDLFDDSVVVVVADHGEEFQEHGKLLHSQLYRECLRVPLLVRAPETRGGATSQLTGLIDVMPTLLELCGAETRGLQGRSFARLLADRDSPSPRDFLTAEVDGELRVLRTPEWILHRAGDAWRLFDARADPGEQRDLVAAGAPPELDRLVALFERTAAERAELRARVSPEQARVRTAAEKVRALERLGYAGGGGDE